ENREWQSAWPLSRPSSILHSPLRLPWRTWRLDVHLFFFQELDSAVLRGALVGGVDQRHGFEVVPAADRRLAACFECDQQLAHRAGEGVGEPASLQRRLLKG